MKLKRLLFVLPLLTLCGCEEQQKQTFTDTIVDKYMDRELDNAATWFFEVPIMQDVYFFKMENYGPLKVEKSTYNSYKIGDKYTWSV